MIVKFSILNENDHLYPSKYKLYIPTEELKKEIERERFNIEQRLENKEEYYKADVPHYLDK